jgi:hypothetical protein
MAKRVELGLIEGAEDNAAGGDGGGGCGDGCGGGGDVASRHYPDLNEARNRERRYLNWGPWYHRRAESKHISKQAQSYSNSKNTGLLIYLYKILTYNPKT